MDKEIRTGKARSILAVAMMLAAGSLFATTGAVKLKWTGAGGDRNWNTPANWVDKDGNALTVLTADNLFKTVDTSAHTGGVELDFSSVSESGVVLTNNCSSKINLSGITCPAVARFGLYRSASDANLYFPRDSFVEIPVSTTFDMNFGMTTTWAEWAGVCTIRGGGKCRMLRKVHTYGHIFSIDANTELSIEVDVSNFDEAATDIYRFSGNGAVLSLQTDTSLAGIRSSEGIRGAVKLNGHALRLVGGSYNSSHTAAFDLTGPGTISVGGGLLNTWDFATSGTAIDGLSIGNGYLTLGSTEKTVDVPAGVSLSVTANGRLVFFGDQTVPSLSGTSATGAIVLPKDGSLTVGGSASAGSTVYSNRLTGAGGLVKKGAGYTLELAGDNTYSGRTEVAEGTLSVVGLREKPRRGEILHLAFDDFADLARDSSTNATPVTKTDTYGLWSSVVGVRGKGVRNDYKAKADMPAGASKGGDPSLGLPNTMAAPSGSTPFTISMWLRPVVPAIPVWNSGPYMYLYHAGYWPEPKGRQVLLQLDSFEKFVANFGVYGDGKDDWHVIYSPVGGFKDGSWHHFVVTYADKVVKIYDNGVCVKEQTLPENLNIGNGDRSFLYNPSNGVFPYSGDFDEFRIAAVAWTADEVRAEYEQSRTYVVDDPVAALPEPVAHWKFNETYTRDDYTFVKDSGPNGYDLCNPDKKTVSVSSVAGAYGGKAYSSGAYRLMLPDKAFPAKFPTGSSPWTVFLRTQTGGAESVPILYWGASGNADAKHVRFYTASNPRYVTFHTGNSSGKVSGAMLPSGNDGSGATWANVAFSYDGSGKITMYHDGRPIDTTTIASLDIATESFVVCGNLTDATKYTSEYVDDIIVYDRKLSNDEIRTVARSMETGAISPALSTNSAVSVASGAKLQFKGLGHEIKALSGAGTVEMAPGSLIDIGATLAFTGAFTGDGALRIGSGISLASSTVATDVYVPEDAVYGTSSLPIVETTGRAFLPEKLTINVDGEVAGSWIEVLAAGSFVGPTDFSKWTVTGRNAHPDPRFKIVDGKLYVRPVRTGLTVLVR